MPRTTSRQRLVAYVHAAVHVKVHDQVNDDDQVNVNVWWRQRES